MNFKSLLAAGLLCVSAFSSAQSISTQDLKHFSVRMLWLSDNLFYTIQSGDKTHANLVQRLSRMPLMYELIDTDNKPLTSVDYTYDTKKDHFEIYDAHHQRIGATDEYLFQYYPTFYVYQNDAEKPSVKAEMNFWGTTLSVYDIDTGKKFAEMYRSYFRNSNYWDFDVTDETTFESRHFDPALLMTVVAIQTDPWLYETSHSASLKGMADRSHNSRVAAMTKLRQEASARVAAVQQKLGMQVSAKPDASLVDAIAKKLEQDFTAIHADDSLDPQKSFEMFLQYCLDSLESGELSDAEKQAVLFLLQHRFE